MTPAVRSYSTEYTTEQLLGFALRMLHQAREEQMASRRKNKWLLKNVTFDTIRQRCLDVGAVTPELVP